jgi:hypothetical protein
MKDVNVETDREFIVTLNDPVDGRKVDCFLLDQITQDGTMYAALMPRDPAVMVALYDEEEGSLTEVEGEELEGKIFTLAQQACKKLDLELLDTAGTLTVLGDVENAIEEVQARGESIEVDADDESGVGEVLAMFKHENKEYVIINMEPPMLAGRQSSGLTFEMPAESEMEEIRPVLETMLTTLAEKAEQLSALDYDDAIDDDDYEADDEDDAEAH